MYAVRKELEESLRSYTTDILTDIQMVRIFCEMFSKWMLCRKDELEMMWEIKDKADKLKLHLSDCVKSEKKSKAFKKYVSNKFTGTDKPYAELERELKKVLKKTLKGLETLQSFLDAIEKLAVSSVHVFMENQVIQLPEDISFDYAQVVINNAKLICPLLLEFKRDDRDFFLPKMQNVELIAYHLDRYIQTTKKMCEEMDTSCLNDDCLMMTEVVVKLDVNLSEVNMQKILDHINQLKDIRMDQNFRMVFLFQEESCSSFMKEFSERQPTMLEFLNELEENAVQLDRMNKGAKISSVAGSSVGAVGGVLSIIGLALSPVTAGASLLATVTGIVMGITGRVNNLVTTATEVVVTQKHQKKASKVSESFIENVTKLRECLGIQTTGDKGVLHKAGPVGGKITASLSKLLKDVGLFSSGGKGGALEEAALHKISKLAEVIPDIGRGSKKISRSMSNLTKAISNPTNPLLLGMDIFFTCKDITSLAKGSETEKSQFIRARAFLWRSEMNSWKKIYDSLSDGLQTSEKKKALLQMPFILSIDWKGRRRFYLTNLRNK